MDLSKKRNLLVTKEDFDYSKKQTCIVALAKTCFDKAALMEVSQFIFFL